MGEIKHGLIAAARRALTSSRSITPNERIVNHHKLSVICAVINTYIHISLLSIKKRNQTNTVFDHSFKHQEDRQKYPAARRIFNSVLGIYKCGITRSFVFDILLKKLLYINRILECLSKHQQ